MSLLRAAFECARRINAEVAGLGWDGCAADGTLASPADSSLANLPIYRALVDTCPQVAATYAQAKLDVASRQRLSWRGTAHEVREAVSTLLRSLAPDSEVMEQPWFTQDPNTVGPTQAQRARFILEARGDGKTERNALEHTLALLDEMVSQLVRDTYSRASDAAHREKGLNEAARLIRYFETIIYDLISVDG
ncbi:MAG: hypothetical protein ACOX2R_11835 [Anaerolineae bacterium]|jgi:hypothetical protein